MNYDKLFKVRPRLDSVVDVIKSKYRPTQNVAIDEAMIPFKGRLSLKQCMLLKPVKRSTKCGNVHIHGMASFAT